MAPSPFLERIFEHSRKLSSLALDQIRNFFNALYVLRAPVLVTAIAVIILAYGDQSREVYKSLAASPTGAFFQTGTALVTLIAVTFLCWYAGRRRAVMRQAAIDAEKERLKPAEKELAEKREASLRPWLRWMPRLVAAAIPASVALGLFITAQEVEKLRHTFDVVQSPPEIEPIRAAALEASAVWWHLTGAAMICILIALGFILWAHLRTRNVEDSHKFPEHWLTAAAVPVSILCLTIVLTISFAIAPVPLAQGLGSMTIVFLFLACLLTITSSLLYLYDRFSIPVISILAVCALVFSIKGWNAHVVTVEPLPYQPESGDLYPDRWETHQAFQHWLSTRADKSRFGKEYPVFIVAAAGGGLYAANHAATFLARMQDLCPNFAQHVFAYSGVSGGSLGVSVFAALARDFAKNEPWKPCLKGLDKAGEFEKKAQAVLHQDFLSPLVASTMFPNFFQFFFPYPLPGTDRASAFAATINENYKSAVGNGASDFSDGFLDFWSTQYSEFSGPDKERKQIWRVNSPTGALVLNSTDVDHGHRVVLSPFKASFIDEAELSGITWFQKDASIPNAERITHDVSLGDAVTMSARFPFVLPAGVIDNHAQLRLVDGGYSDNSGVETALEIIRYLKRYEVRGDVKLYLILIRSVFDLGEINESAPAHGLAPLNALLSVQEGRGQVAVGRALLERSPCRVTYTPGCENNPPTEVLLNLRDFKIPLAWQLSPSTLSIIEAHSGSTRPAIQETNCEVREPAASDEPLARSRENIFISNCAIQRLVNTLNKDASSLEAAFAEGEEE